ncbi:hypothetical protein [Methylobacterium sp. Leaf118]|uniref:hypothetical protein n=1 Tax=Methylobacterium sp. Leaf118 TaxID=2876562 RepID=UPI001E5346A2|nr:hypothetical protein [Methylobacterium sp. Leaf118]
MSDHSRRAAGTAHPGLVKRGPADLMIPALDLRSSCRGQLRRIPNKISDRRVADDRQVFEFPSPYNCLRLARKRLPVAGRSGARTSTQPRRSNKFLPFFRLAAKPNGHVAD